MYILNEINIKNSQYAAYRYAKQFRLKPKRVKSFKQFQSKNLKKQ